MSVTSEPDKRRYYRARGTYKGNKYDLRSYSRDTLDEKVRAFKNSVDVGDTLHSPNITVKTWAETWLEVFKKPSVIEKSYKEYKANINNHIAPKIGSMKMTDVKQYHLQGILNARADKSRTQISKLKNTMTGMFSKAFSNNIITSNPATGLVIPAEAKAGTHRPLTKEEEIALLEVCKTHYAGTFCLLMYYCGLRPGECSALMWNDIDCERNLIHVRRATESGTRGKVKKPKTKAGIRSLPIPDIFAQRLSREKEESNSGYILLCKSHPLTDNDLHRWFKSIIREMDILMGAELHRNKIVKSKIQKPFSAYCLRHTYCTNLQKAGVSLNIAKYLMGHDDIKMTASIYTHQTDDQTLSAAKSINNFFTFTRGE